MNKKLVAFLIPLIVVWGFFISKMGFNVFSIFFGGLASIFYIVAIGSWIDGGLTYQSKKYLADKAKEEQAKKVD